METQEQVKSLKVHFIDTDGIKRDIIRSAISGECKKPDIENLLTNFEFYVGFNERMKIEIEAILFKSLSDEFYKNLLEWLGDDGVLHFKQHIDDLIPLHLNSGMKVRNWMRGHEETKHWDDHQLDNLWQAVIRKVLV